MTEMMNRSTAPRRTRVTWFGPMVGSTLLAGAMLAGCADQEAADRAAAADAVEAAAAKLQLAVGGAPAERRQLLNGAISAARSVTHQSQTSAAALVSSSARVELGAVGLNEAAIIEARRRSARDELGGYLDAITILELGVRKQGAQNGETAVAALEQTGRLNESRLQQLESFRSQLQTQIDPLVAANDKDRAQVDELLDRANELFGRFNELGPADGLASFEEAIKTTRAADRLEYEIAQRENKLGELEPNRDILTAQIDATQNEQAALEETRNAILARANEAASRANAMRQRADVMRNGDSSRAGLSGVLQQLDREATAELNALYQTTLTELQTAADEATRASSGLDRDGKNAAVLIAGAAHRRIGDLHWMQARGLADHAAVMRRMQIIGDNGAGLDPVTNAYQDARTKAVAAYQQAMAQYGQAGAADASLAVQNVLDALEGADLPTQPETTAAARPIVTTITGGAGDGDAPEK